MELANASLYDGATSIAEAISVAINKTKRDEIVMRMKLTSKDEFEVLSKRVENLEKKIDKLYHQKTKKTKRAKKF